MIILINGAFGLGKTSLAEKIAREHESFMLFDPEEVGFMLRNVIPKSFKKAHENTGDFQDLDVWRKLTVDVLKALKDQYQCHFVIPMTLRNAHYRDEIEMGLRVIDSEIHTILLSANKETIHRRLLERGDAPMSWAFDQTDKCLEDFKLIKNAWVIDTETMTIEDIYKRIKEKLMIGGLS